jgi:predicted transcriptional regulator
MNAYESQPVRNTYNVSWQEEYILGMINHVGALNGMRVINECQSDTGMSLATAHKYLKQNVSKKLVKQKRTGREVHFSLTDRGIKFLEELKNASR